MTLSQQKLSPQNLVLRRLILPADLATDLKGSRTRPCSLWWTTHASICQI
jgi:hypothetical protein